jgi:acetyl-CoA acetyltransferase
MMRKVVLVDGCRLPFTLAGTAYKDLLAVDLGRLALKGLLTKTAIDPKLIDYLYLGNINILLLFISTFKV